jgi:hypothetical protein
MHDIGVVEPVQSGRRVLTAHNVVDVKPRRPGDKLTQLRADVVVLAYVFQCAASKLVLKLTGMFMCASSKELPICFSATHAQAAVNLLLACVDLGKAAGKGLCMAI